MKFDEKMGIWIDRKVSDGVYDGFRTAELSELQTKDDGENGFIIIGHSNTKDKADAYGEIPTNYNGKPVYDFTRFKKNPILFIDHKNSAAKIAGKFLKFEEDKKGLYFEALLRPLDEIYSDDVKDAVSAYMSGFGKALSIGGRWYFEDKENPTHLTRAFIHEISLVGIGADPRALVRGRRKKEAESAAAKGRNALVSLVASYRKDPSIEAVNNINEHIQSKEGVKV